MIASVFEETPGILGADRSERLAYRFNQSLTATGCRPA